MIDIVDPYESKNDTFTYKLNNALANLLELAFNYANGRIDEVHILFDLISMKFEIFYTKDGVLIRPEDLAKTIIQFRYFEMRFSDLCSDYCDLFVEYNKLLPHRIQASAYAYDSDKNSLLYDYSPLKSLVPFPEYLRILKESFQQR